MELFGASAAGKVKKAARLLADARPLMDKDAISARRKLEESLALLQSVPPDTQARTGTLTVTLLALARLERLASNHPRAVQLLEQALDLRTGLSEDDRNYLVVEYARAGRTDARALDQYLAYVSLRTLDPTAGPSGVVYSLLDQSCRLDDNTPPEEYPDRLALCARLIACDGRLGMPYYYRGWHSFKSGNYAAAIEDLNQAVERGVTHPQLLYVLHLCMGHQEKSIGSLDHAAHHFVEAARQNSSCFTANFEGGKCLLELCSKNASSSPVPENVTASRRAYGIELLERASMLDYRSAIAHFTLGQAHYSVGNNEKAESALRSAAALQPCAPYHYEHARALRRCGALAEAVKAAERALHLEPSHIKSQWLVSNTSLQLRDFNRANAGFHRLVADLPPDHPLHRNALYGLGVCAFETGDYPGAIESFSSLQSQDLELTPEGRLMLARSYLHMGELARAEDLLKELAGSGEQKGLALYYLGCCLARSGHYEAALNAYTDAESAGAPTEKCLFRRGQVHEALGEMGAARAGSDAERPELDTGRDQQDRARGELGAARQGYAAALEAKELPEARYRLGLLCWKMGAHEEALVHMRRADQSPQALAAQAELSELTGDAAESARLFQLALDASPNNPDIRRRFVASLIRAGDGKRALAVLEGVKLDATDPATLYLLGLAHLFSGAPEKAIAVWKSVPHTPEVDSAIRIAALQEARLAHDLGQYDRSLERWNIAIEQGLDDAGQKQQLAIATAAAALRGAGTGAPAEEWTQKLRVAEQLDPENVAIVLLACAAQVASGSLDAIDGRIEQIAESGEPEHKTIAAYLLGIAMLGKKDAAGALTYLRTAFCQESSQLKEAVRLPYAFALAHTGRCSDAADVLRGKFED